MDQRFAVPGVGARTILSDAAPELLLVKARPLFELEQAAAGGADMDAVHDMRVASRRLRETMRLLAPIYPSREFSAWYRRVRRITRALGPVRDSDVFIDDFSRLSRHLGEGGRRTVAFMVGYRMGQREHELAKLNRELDKVDLAESRSSFARLARSVRKTAESKRRLADFAHAAVAARAAVVFGALPPATVEANTAQQHALRIDFKRLRYAVEVFAPCYGDEFDDLHDTLTEFQDTLGNLHDLHVFLDMLHAPERVAAATKAGVSASDIEEVVTLLETRAHREFTKFSRLATNQPAEVLLPSLLLPLSRVPEPVPEPEVPPGAEPTEAVVVEPATPLALSPDLGFAALAIESPVVVGAEPWAVPPVRPAPEPSPDQNETAVAAGDSTTPPDATEGDPPAPEDTVPALAEPASGADA